MPVFITKQKSAARQIEIILKGVQLVGGERSLAQRAGMPQLFFDWHPLLSE
jgi:hypothetical protein